MELPPYHRLLSLICLLKDLVVCTFPVLPHRAQQVQVLSLLEILVHLTILMLEELVQVCNPVAGQEKICVMKYLMQISPYNGSQELLFRTEINRRKV